MCFQASKGPSTVTDKPVDEADISETGRLFLRNLPYSASEEDIRELFEPFGELTDCHLVLDRYDAQHHAAQHEWLLLSLSSCCSVVPSGAFVVVYPLPPLVCCCRERRTSKGLAYVTYLMPEDAVRAAAELDANDFQVRLSASLCPLPSPPGPLLLLLMPFLDIMSLFFVVVLLRIPSSPSLSAFTFSFLFSAQGRLLHILPARLPPHSKTTAAPAEDSTNFKAKKEADLKSQAGNRCGSNLRPPPPPLHPFDLQSHQ